MSLVVNFVLVYVYSVVFYWFGWHRVSVQHVKVFYSISQEVAEAAAEEKKSNHVQRKLEKRQQDRKIDSHIEEQFASGRLLAAISSRPGQCGRADGYEFSSLFNLSRKL